MPRLSGVGFSIIWREGTLAQDFIELDPRLLAFCNSMLTIYVSLPIMQCIGSLILS